jgi:sporulation protein YlmC with PRC-barrel domain
MKFLGHAVLCGAMGVAQLTASAFPAPQAETTPSEKVVTVTAFRASKLVGMNVKNAEGEDLGKINELVLDVESGKVMYAALSMGGVLGVGDKLLAIPWKEFQLKHDEDDSYFVLAIAKAKLEAAPGFDEENWPDFADKNWRDEIDQYYRAEKEAVRDATVAPRSGQ